jgi:adenine-specific DNA-methyltransferase
MDQYYIKSSELLRDYTFHIRRADLTAGELPLTDLPEEVVIHFKLVEGDTEKDNRKPNGKATRAFTLDDEKPFSEDGPAMLTIRFRYREHPTERNLQTKLNADTEKTLADNLRPKWKAVLFAPDRKYQGKDKKDTRTIVQKHLRSYTAKYQFDYFVHKDLGSFLRRELDFYIKNEVMYLDDIEDLGASKAEEYLSKIRALRRCAVPVISMLEQLENFQKKLWLKKKFVVETRYCLTLDRVPETLYPQIAANAAQREEWLTLYAINEIQKDMVQPGYSEPLTVEFLKANPYLMLDTRHFGRDFMLELLASVENLDEMLDGTCFHAENFQALQLMQERYREQVKCVYIDPPYNTSSSAILYKNDYRHSSWAALLLDRLAALRPLFQDDGVIFVSIDKLERTVLEGALDTVFGRENRVEELIWTQNTANSQLPTYSTNHEYVEVYAKSLRTVEKVPEMFREQKPGYSEIMELVTRLSAEYTRLNMVEESIKDLFKQHLIEFKDQIEATGQEWDDETVKLDPWKGIYNYWRAEYRDADGKWVSEDRAAELKATIWVWREISPSAPASKQAASTKDPSHPNYRYYRPLHPQTGKPCPHPRGGWKFPLHPDPENPDRKSFTQLAADNRIAWGDDERKVPQTKGFLHEVETNIATSAFYEYNDGEAEVAALFGASGLFLSPKSSKFVRRFIAQTTNGKNDVVLDCFGGSGSTAHAVIGLNRESHGKRRFVTAEVGKLLETLIVPRLKKSVYSSAWKDGKPQNRNTGVSHAFKIVRLEGYEDALNNLRLKRTPEQEAALKGASEEACDQYMLGYFLDVESAGSASLLQLEQFRDPFGYKLKIANSSAGETKEKTIDLVETFNWLLGLKVKHIDAQRGFLTVTGEKRAGGRTLVIWRTLSDDPVKDNEVLEQFLGKLQVNPADTEFNFIYVNGSHTLSDPHNKIHLIEEAFHRLMFDNQSFQSLS